MSAPLPLVWTCEFCDLPISDTTGFLGVRDRELATRHDKVLSWEAETLANTEPAPLGAIPMSAVLNHPGYIRWFTLHYDCDPSDGCGVYPIPVEEARTPTDMLRWTSHLMLSKDWLGDTNWGEILGRVADNS